MKRNQNGAIESLEPILADLPAPATGKGPLRRPIYTPRVQVRTLRLLCIFGGFVLQHSSISVGYNIPYMNFSLCLFAQQRALGSLLECLYLLSALRLRLQLYWYVMVTSGHSLLMYSWYLETSSIKIHPGKHTPVCFEFSLGIMLYYKSKKNIAGFTGCAFCSRNPAKATAKNNYG